MNLSCFPLCSSALVAAFCAVAATAHDRPVADALPPAIATPDSASDTVALTPEQREAALEHGAARADPAFADPTKSDRAIHGEMGVAVGTGGYRAAYGTAAVPIGNDAAAAFSFEADRYRNKHRRRKR